MRVDDADGAVAGLAASQHGAITRFQAASLGMSAKMIRARRVAGMLVEPVAGVLVLNSAPPSWRQRLMVAVLAAGEGALVAFDAAAALHGSTASMKDLSRSACLGIVVGHRCRGCESSKPPCSSGVTAGSSTASR